MNELRRMIRGYAAEISAWAGDVGSGQWRQIQGLLESRRHRLGSDAWVLLWIFAGVCAIVFLSTLRVPPSFMVIWNYLALMTAAGVVGGLLTWHATRRWPSLGNWLLAAAFGWPFVAAVLWGQLDAYEEEWSRNIGSKEYPNWIDGVDTRFRWSGQLTYQKLRLNPDGDWKERVDVEGPISPSGKRHGEWKTHYWDFNQRDTSQFYWYGDQISEGDWHLRNR